VVRDVQRPAPGSLGALRVRLQEAASTSTTLQLDDIAEGRRRTRSQRPCRYEVAHHQWKPFAIYEHLFYRQAVGLTWKARGGERSMFDGRDASGRFYAQVTNISGPWTIYLAPWACGRKGGLATGPYEDASEAMAAADHIVAVYVGDDA